VKQRPPDGFGLYGLKEIREFIGTREETARILSAVCYVMGVPGVDTTDARTAAEKLYAEELRLIQKDHKKYRNRTDGLPEFLSMVLGEKFYRNPDIYTIDVEAFGDPRDLADDLTRLCGLADSSDATMLTGTDFAAIAGVFNPANVQAALRETPETVLSLAAFYARLLFGIGLLKLFRPPRANGLVLTWTFLLSAMRAYPTLVSLGEQGRYWLPRILSAVNLEELASQLPRPRQDEGAHEYGERMIISAVEAWPGIVERLAKRKICEGCET